MSAENDQTRVCADLVWDDKQQPVSKQFDDVYFSRENGIEETRYVFIEHNQLPERWQNLSTDQNFFIAEAGFGTGLNFLASWRLWDEIIAARCPTSHLHFFSVEKYPLTKADLQRALMLWPELSSYAKQLLDAWPPHFIRGAHKLEFAGVTLHLFFGDILEGLQQIFPSAGASLEQQKPAAFGSNRILIDAWFLDGFAPAKNPEMWQSQIFQWMAGCSKPNASFATFTCAGEVRRGLEAAGFRCKKTKGFGKKREMLSGFLDSATGAHGSPEKNTGSPLPSWSLVEPLSTANRIRTAVVVGGGLAGCHAAYALARRGLKVTLLDKANTLASEASANRRGVLYTRLSPDSGALNQFNFSAFFYACRFYHNAQLFSDAGAQCGVLHLATSEKEQQQYLELGKLFANYPQDLLWCSAETCSELVGMPTKTAGIFLPKAGWLDPLKVCHALSRHPNIRVCLQANLESFARVGGVWQINTPSENLEADVLVLANAHQVSQFDQTRHLALKQIRGQVSYIPQLPSELRQPATVICADGYMAPYGEQGLCLGASFNLGSSLATISEQDHRENIQRFREIFPQYTEQLQTLNTDELEGLVGFRSTTPDYFPIVGPLPAVEEFVARFQLYRKNANAVSGEYGSYHPGLYCLSGLGSRGLAYAPLAADTLASCIFGEPLPLDNQLWLHLHPGRFIIRNLIRNRPIPGLN